MPTIQGVFPLRQDAGLPGGAAMSRYGSETGVVENVAGIAFGTAVARGVDPQGIIPLATGGVFLGITRQDKGVAAGVGDRYPQYKPAAYFVSGHVYVIADAAVAVDAQVRFNTATNRFTSAAASGTVIDCPNWTFDRPATAAGQLVIIKR